MLIPLAISGLIIAALAAYTFTLKKKLNTQGSESKVIAPEMGDLRHDSVSEIDAQYGVVLDSIAEGIIVTDATGAIRTANQPAISLLGEPGAALVGVPAGGVINLRQNNTDIAQADHPINKVISARSTFRADRYDKKKLFIKRLDGTSFRAELTLNPVQIEGILNAVVITFTDLTEFDRIDRAKGEFVSLASHQLRTPLNVASWYIEKLIMQKKGPLNEKQMQYATQVYQNNKRMVSLVGDLLNASRVDLGRINVKKEEVDLIGLAIALRDEIGIAMEQKSITFSHEFPSSDIVYQDGDISITTVIIQNLLSNALKYTNEGGHVHFKIEIVSSGTQLNPAKPFITKKEGVHISVADDGVGIPKEQQDKIFSKLFRASNTDELDVQGTGLGLYVTQSFAIAVNGEIWFESIEGTGTTFSVFIPFPTPLIRKSSIRRKAGQEQNHDNASANTPSSGTVVANEVSS